MAKVSTSISLEADVKDKAALILSELGLDLSTAVGMFLRQTIRERRIPFEVTLNTPNVATLEALNEFEEMRKDPSKYKRYSSFSDAMKEVLSDA